MSNPLKGTTTDFDGKYQIEVPDKESVLLFSYVRFSSQERVIIDTVLNVIMSEDTSKLEEVVIVGYGSVKRKDLTGSVGTLKAKDLGFQPTSLSVRSSIKWSIGRS